MGTVTTLLLARHGEIQANVEHRWHGSTDSDLTAAGREQARRLASYLVREREPIEAIYTSPMRRARQTAAPIASAFGLEPVPMAQLQEFGIGVLENHTYADLVEGDRFYRRIARDNHFAPEGGESVVAVAERMLDAVNAIAGNHPGKTVLLVSHGAAIAILLTHVLRDRYFPFHDYHSSNTGLTQLLCGERFELGYFDRTRHLNGAEADGVAVRIGRD